MKTIAWIGTGVMGASMAIHLRKQGHIVYAYNRTFAKAKVLEEYGIIPSLTIAQAVKDADVIFTMVGFPSDVKEVYYTEYGIFSHVKPGAIAIDMTTSSPALAKQLYEDGLKKQIAMLDAPVSGGDIGARNATLSIMVGGDEHIYQEVMPLFEVMGKNINYMGPAGSGQHTKMSNQIAVAGATAAMSEAIVYAKAVGLDPAKMLAAISSGAAGSWQLTNSAPRVLKEDFAPGFFIKHFVKDMKLAKESIEHHQIQLAMLDTVCEMYEELMRCGFENDGTQALIKYYESCSRE